jgi:hypothetical protein
MTLTTRVLLGLVLAEVLGATLGAAVGSSLALARPCLEDRTPSFRISPPVGEGERVCFEDGSCRLALPAEERVRTESADDFTDLGIGCVDDCLEPGDDR